ncbi:MAG: sulfotransferase [Pseudomonadota bacterium]
MTAQFAYNQPSQVPTNRAERRKAQAQRDVPAPKDIAQLTELLRQQQFAEGGAAAERFAKRWPGHPLGWTVLGMCLTALGAFREAEPALRKALPLAPNNAAVANCLGVVLKAVGKPSEARAVLSQAVASDPGLVDARFNLAQTLRDLDRHDEALSSLRIVLEQTPQNDAARMAYAHGLKESGDLAGAEAEYRTLLSRNPEKPNDRIHLNFAAGKAFQDLNDDPDTAFAHYQTGNSLKRATMRYDVSQDVGHMTKIAEHCTDVECLLPAPGPDDTSPTPIFIVGMPRSGTTLIEQILASHPEVSPGGERKDLERSAKAFEERTGARFPHWSGFLTTDEAHEVRRQYLDGLREADDQARWITDKMPSNIKLVSIVAQTLPGAKIIHMRRDALDTCFSCYTQLFTEGNAFSYDLLDLAAYYNAYQKLADHWQGVLSSDLMLSVDYERLTAEPEEIIRGVLAFCGLEWDPACLDFHTAARPVKTASTAQVRRPLYRSSVGRWQPYRTHLTPLIDGLTKGTHPALGHS